MSHQYIIVVGSGASARSMGASRSREDALKAFGRLVRIYGHLYHPHGRSRLRVMPAGEWERVRPPVPQYPPAPAGLTHDLSPSLRGCGAMVASTVGSAVVLISACGFAFLPTWLAVAIPAALVVAIATVLVLARRGRARRLDERRPRYQDRQANPDLSGEELDRLWDRLRDRGKEQDQ